MTHVPLTEAETSAWSIVSVLQEYGAGLLLLGLVLLFLVRNLRTGQSTDSPGKSHDRRHCLRDLLLFRYLSVSWKGLAHRDVSADEMRKKRLEELQRQYDEQALAEQRKVREKETEKLNEMDHQLQRMRGQATDSPADQSRLRASHFNPLMGQSSGTGYRPQKRKPPGGGCCGGGGCG